MHTPEAATRRSSPRPRSRRARAATAAALAVVLVAAALGACSSGDDLASGEGAPGAADVASTSAERSGSGGDGFAAPVADDVDEAPAPPGVPTDVRGDHVVRTAEITLEMADTERSLAEVRRVVERVGGTVATADLRRDRPAGDLGGVIVVRVPTDDLLGTLDGLEELAVDAPVRRIDERDVTSEVVDLAARITNLTAYERELRSLLTEVREGTSDADRLLPVFERVQEVRADIDRLTAQRDALEDRVARSTITVTVRPAPGAEPVPATTWAPGHTFERALATSAAALARLADGAIWLTVVALPVALVLLVPTALAVRSWRRVRPGRVAVTDASAPSTGTDAG